MKQLYKIGEIAKLYGISPDTLRYYENLGLISPKRLESGYRQYRLQDIWRLNTIRELRQLDFPMEKIRQSLQDHTLESTRELLEQEQAEVTRQMEKLERIRKNLTNRMQLLDRAHDRVCGEIRAEMLPDRAYFSVSQSYSEDFEMDFLVRKLAKLDRDHFYIIGSNQLGSIIAREDAEQGKIRYDSVFQLDEKGDRVFPEGMYLTVSYRGSYEKSSLWLRKLLAFAGENGYTVDGDLLELLWIEIHTTAREEEYLTELQLPVKKIH